MRGGEPSVLQTPPRPNQGGNPPRTPLFNTRLVKTGTPPALLYSYCTVVQYGTVVARTVLMVGNGGTSTRTRTRTVETKS